MSLAPHLATLRSFIHKNEVVKKYADLVEEKTKAPIEYIVAGLGIIPLIMVYYGYFGKTISDLVGFVYPFYATITAIEAKSDDIGYWLTYWVVYSLFDVFEDILDTLLNWLPFFYPLKIAFFLWLFMPQTEGAKTIYNVAVLPTYTKIKEVLTETKSE